MDKNLCNIMLGIFGSSLLAWFSALIAYKVTRREAIMEYLYSLRTYRRKFRRLISTSKNTYLEKKENLEDYFDEWLAIYSRTGHICKCLCKYRKIPKTLDMSFQLVVDVQGNLNCNHTEYKSYAEDIDQAIELIENLAKEKKYLHVVKKVQNDGQTENGNP